jgi:sodium/potassium-transporting ATPase subunit alpha
MKSILNLLPAETVAMREGESRKVASADLVVGDIVKVTIGNKVPADIRLLSTSGDVRFDRSMLTGESEEIEGSTNMTDKNFLETRNIALMGTMVTNGSATGVVILTGGNSVMGRIANATTSIKDVPTHIQREISRFVRIIVCLTVVLACTILFTWVGWIRVDHYAFMNVIQMLNNVMGCVVAFIPEGMPVGVALTLMIVARRMRSKNILPKGLATVETLGCVNVLCSDKTGTLTENRMVVTSVSFVDKCMPVDEALSILSTDSSQSLPLENLHQASVLCNDASFDVLTMDRPVLERDIQGNATDGATLKFAELARTGMCGTISDASPRVFQIPFNSKNKWMLTLHKCSDSPAADDASRFLMLVKGAPDVFCNHTARLTGHTSVTASSHLTMRQKRN